MHDAAPTTHYSSFQQAAPEDAGRPTRMRLSRKLIIDRRDSSAIDCGPDARNEDPTEALCCRSFEAGQVAGRLKLKQWEGLRQACGSLWALDFARHSGTERGCSEYQLVR